MSQLQSPFTFIITKRAARYGLLLGTVLLNISWTFGHVYPDSDTYLRIAGYFLGDGEVTGLLVFRPLVPFLASLLSPVFGLEGSFAVLSSLFWLGASVLIYHSVGRLSGSDGSLDPPFDHEMHDVLLIYHGQMEVLLSIVCRTEREWESREWVW